MQAMGDTLLPFPWFDLILILALIAVNGVLSMSELAIVSAREARLKAMAKSGSAGAKCALELAAEPGRFLSTVQTGITLIGILAGAYSGASLGEPVAQRLVPLGMEPETSKSVGFGIVIVVTTYASLIIGELVPKQFALRNPEAIAAVMARPMSWLSVATAPFVWILDRTSARESTGHGSPLPVLVHGGPGRAGGGAASPVAARAPRGAAGNP